MQFRRLTYGLLLIFLPSVLFAEPLYRPPGYGPGENIEGTGFGIDSGFKQIDDQSYITLTPLLEFPLFGFRIGLQIPLEILVLDRDPESDLKVPSLREGMYSEWEDYTQMIAYIRRGQHLYYNPGDAFNWSMFYGKMTDGYIGHRTIIHRYVNNYSPTVYRGGLMADINNDWGGIEVFSSDVMRREVEAGRIYIRPYGVFRSTYNALFAVNSSFEPKAVATSLRESRNPDLQRGILFQTRVPDHGQGGALQQHLHPRMEESLDLPGFEEYTDPVTGRTEMRPVRPDDPDRTDRRPPDGSAPGTAPDHMETAPMTDEDGRSPIGSSIFNRWAIGYTVARDYNAPAVLETDGSGNLVVDPETLRPRGLEEETLTIVGIDTEFRLSPFRWLDLTPYVDVNRFKDYEGSEGVHAGIIMDFRVGRMLSVTFRPEYREMSSNYIPAYFDSYHSIERTIYQPGRQRFERASADLDDIDPQRQLTKLGYFQGLPQEGGPRVEGYHAQLFIDILRLFVLDVNYEDYTGEDNSSIFAGIYLHNLGGFFLNGYYLKKDFNAFDQAFEFDDRSIAAGELGYVLFAGLYVKVVYQRTWEFDQTTSAFEPRDEQSFHFGFRSNL